MHQGKPKDIEKIWNPDRGKYAVLFEFCEKKLERIEIMLLFCSAILNNGRGKRVKEFSITILHASML